MGWGHSDDQTAIRRSRPPWVQIWRQHWCCTNLFVPLIAPQQLQDLCVDEFGLMLTRIRKWQYSVLSWEARCLKIWTFINWEDYNVCCVHNLSCAWPVVQNGPHFMLPEGMGSWRPVALDMGDLHPETFTHLPTRASPNLVKASFPPDSQLLDCRPPDCCCLHLWLCQDFYKIQAAAASLEDTSDASPSRVNSCVCDHSIKQMCVIYLQECEITAWYVHESALNLFRSPWCLCGKNE